MVHFVFPPRFSDPVSDDRVPCNGTIAMSGKTAPLCARSFKSVESVQKKLQKNVQYIEQINFKTTCLVYSLVSSADSGLRLPLMWRDSAYFNNRGSTFVFVLPTSNPLVLLSLCLVLICGYLLH